MEVGAFFNDNSFINKNAGPLNDRLFKLVHFISLVISITFNVVIKGINNIIISKFMFVFGILKLKY